MNSSKKLFFNFIFNLSLFTFLIIVFKIVTKKRINLLINQTIELPVSFIIGVSFITGSLLSSFLKINKSLKD